MKKLSKGRGRKEDKREEREGINKYRFHVL